MVNDKELVSAKYLRINKVDDPIPEDIKTQKTLAQFLTHSIVLKMVLTPLAEEEMPANQMAVYTALKKLICKTCAHDESFLYGTATIILDACLYAMNIGFDREHPNTPKNLAWIPSVLEAMNGFMDRNIKPEEEGRSEIIPHFPLFIARLTEAVMTRRVLGGQNAETECDPVLKSSYPFSEGSSLELFSLWLASYDATASQSIFQHLCDKTDSTTLRGTPDQVWSRLTGAIVSADLSNTILHPWTELEISMNQNPISIWGACVKLANRHSLNEVPPEVLLQRSRILQPKHLKALLLAHPNFPALYLNALSIVDLTQSKGGRLYAPLEIEPEAKQSLYHTQLYVILLRLVDYFINCSEKMKIAFTLAQRGTEEDSLPFQRFNQCSQFLADVLFSAEIGKKFSHLEPFLETARRLFGFSVGTPTPTALMTIAHDDLVCWLENPRIFSLLRSIMSALNLEIDDLPSSADSQHILHFRGAPFSIIPKAPLMQRLLQEEGEPLPTEIISHPEAEIPRTLIPPAKVLSALFQNVMTSKISLSGKPPKVIFKNFYDQVTDYLNDLGLTEVKKVKLVTAYLIYLKENPEFLYACWQYRNDYPRDDGLSFASPSRVASGNPTETKRNLLSLLSSLIEGAHDHELTISPRCSIARIKQGACCSSVAIVVLGALAATGLDLERLIKDPLDDGNSALILDDLMIAALAVLGFLSVLLPLALVWKSVTTQGEIATLEGHPHPKRYLYGGLFCFSAGLLTAAAATYRVEEGEFIDSVDYYINHNMTFPTNDDNPISHEEIAFVTAFYLTVFLAGVTAALGLFSSIQFVWPALRKACSSSDQASEEGSIQLSPTSPFSHSRGQRPPSDLLRQPLLSDAEDSPLSDSIV